MPTPNPPKPGPRRLSGAPSVEYTGSGYRRLKNWYVVLPTGKRLTRKSGLVIYFETRDEAREVYKDWRKATEPDRIRKAIEFLSSQKVYDQVRRESRKALRKTMRLLHQIHDQTEEAIHFLPGHVPKEAYRLECERALTEAARLIRGLGLTGSTNAGKIARSVTK